MRSKKRPVRSNRPPPRAKADSLRLPVPQVNADVKAGVIPVGVVIAAPSPVIVHPGDVAIHLAAFVAEAARIAVDFGAIGL